MPCLIFTVIGEYAGENILYFCYLVTQIGSASAEGATAKKKQIFCFAPRARHALGLVITAFELSPLLSLRIGPPSSKGGVKGHYMLLH